MRISYYLSRPNTENESGIYARLCYAGEKVKYYLPESITPKFWSTKTQRAKQVSAFEEFPEFNARLDKFTVDIKNLYRKYLNDNENNMPSVQTLRSMIDDVIKKKELSKKPDHNFLAYFASIIDQTSKGLRHNSSTGKPISKNTLKTYQTTYNHLAQYQTETKTDFSFESISQHFYDDYKRFLTTTLKQSSNTIGKDFKIIKMVLNEATDKGIKTNLAFKTKRFAVIKHDVDSIYLNEKELAQMAALDLSAEPTFDKVRDLFLLGCYTGLRYSDSSMIRKEDIKENIIHITQVKTGVKVAVPLHNIVAKLLKKYDGLLPKSLSNQKTNEYLKKIARKIEALHVETDIKRKKAGLKNADSYIKWEIVTTHTARRSFATNMYLAGVPSISLMQVTGHKKESSFMKYIKLSPTDHAKVLAMNWKEKEKLSAV